MPYDIFISYSRRDNQQGRITQLVELISRDFQEFAGRPLRPFFDITEIHGMDDWRHRILQGLRESRLLLACLSPSFLDSPYCEWEFNEYLNHEVARGFVGEGVAPVYFVEVPGWDDRDFEKQTGRWVADLRRRNQIDLRPWFKEGEEALRNRDVQARVEQLRKQITERVQRGERAEQSLGNVDSSNAHFIGRLTELRRLRETVALGKLGVLTAVHGLGGIGKTALAIEYAHAFGHEYGGGRWLVRCEGRDNLAAVLATLAPPLKVEFSEAEKLDTKLQSQRVLAELRELAMAHEPHRCLLLLDNVDQAELLKPAQAQQLSGEGAGADWLHVIATTRLGENDLFARHQDRAFLPVDELPEADAVELMESFQPDRKFASDKDREAAREIVNLLSRFTLAVEAAAVYLGQFAGDVTFAGFLERMQKEGLEGLEGAARETTEGVRHDDKSLTATLQPTLERLSEAEKLALTYAALLPADQIALPWIRVLVAEQFSEFGHDSQPGYPDPWQNVLRRLLGLRMWQPTNVTDVDGHPVVVRMHRLLQELVRNNAGDSLEQLEQKLTVHLQARARFLFDGRVEHQHRWELGPLAACAWQYLEREGDLGAWLASQVGVSLKRLGNFAESERLQTRSMETIKPDNPNYAACLNNQALLLQDTNRLAEAEPLLRRALAIEEQNYGPEHPEVATDLNNLAMLLKDTNRLAEAEPLLRRSLAIVEQSYVPEHPKVATSLNNLAQLLKATNRLAEAEPLMRRALAIDEQSYGSEHPEVARDLNNLALLLHSTNRLAEAEPLLRRALAIDERSYGSEHPEVAVDLNNLAQLLKDTNRLAEVEPLMRRALAINEQSYGQQHPAVATGLNNLASLLHSTNRLAEAERLIRRALAIDEQSYGSEHPDVARDLNNLVHLLKTTNRLAEAEPLMRRALAIDERSYGPEHPKVATRLNNLASLLLSTNRFAEAEPLVRRALAIFEQSFGPTHPKSMTVRLNLTQLLEVTSSMRDEP